MAVITISDSQNSTETQEDRPSTNRAQEVRRQQIRRPRREKVVPYTINTRYQALVELDDHKNNNVDEFNSLWNTVKKSYQETSKEIMGHREKKHKEWISQEARQKIKERRNIKQKLLGINKNDLRNNRNKYIKKPTER